jgi:hypothetical protein
MFGKKKKSKNKFHLPTVDPKNESTHKPSHLFSDEMSPEIYDSQGLANDENNSERTGSITKCPFIVGNGHLAEKKPTRNWAIYYRDRDHAGAVGDPLLKMVEAGSREEAESKAKLGEGHENTELIAVNTNNPIVHSTNQSDFSFPSPQTVVNQAYPKVFRFMR